MANSTTITLASNVANAPYGLLTITETAVSSSGTGSSTISYSLVLKRPYSVTSNNGKYAVVTINGAIHEWWGMIAGQGDLYMISGTDTVAHNSDGTKTLAFSARIDLAITDWGPSHQAIPSISNSGTLTLTPTARYPEVSQSLASRTETTMTISWTADVVCTELWYSLDGGSSWSSSMSINNSSGSYTIRNLSAGTTYSVVTAARSKESGLWKGSKATSWRTYDYPYASKMPSFSIGSKLTITVYNPLKREVSVTINVGNQSRTAGNTITGTTISGFNSTDVDGWVPWLYARIPSSTSGSYSVTVTYGNNSTTRSGGTFSTVKADCKPVIGAITYQDYNSDAYGITGDRSKIIQNASLPGYTATGVVGRHSADISSVRVTVNGTTWNLGHHDGDPNTTWKRVNLPNLVVIDSATNLTCTCVATDTRGYTTSKSFTMTMLPYQAPELDVTLARQSGYYSASTIRVDVSLASLNGGNYCETLHFRYKRTTASDSSWANSWIDIEDGVEASFTANNKYEWNVQVVAIDRIGGTSTFNAILGKGIPIFYLDALRNSVGINCFPESDEALWVNGEEILPSKLVRWGSIDQFEWLEADEVYESGLDHSQGMACDGSNIYITHRNSYDNTVPMKITKLNLADWSTVSTHTMTTGHYNSLYWYENRLYSSGASLNGQETSSDVDYSNIRVINSDWSTYLKASPSCWGVGVRKFDNKGYITAIWSASTRDILFYDSYVQDSENVQTRLAKTTLDFTGSTTVQGSFHMTDNYIWVLETAYSADTRASGHQVVRCFSYSGMLVKAFYLDSITDELQDIWVSDANDVMYINDRNGRIYKFLLPSLYHTLVSSIRYANALKPGTVKHVYYYPSNLDSGRTFYRENSDVGYNVVSKFPLSDYAFTGEIGEMYSPTLWVTNEEHKGHVGSGAGYIYFQGTYTWTGGSSMSWSMRFTRGSDQYNYYYYLSRLTIRGRDPNDKTEDHPDGLGISFNATSQDGDLNVTGEGTLHDAFDFMYGKGWFVGNMYVDGISYAIGLPGSNSNLDIL